MEFRATDHGDFVQVIQFVRDAGEQIVVRSATDQGGYRGSVQLFVTSGSRSWPFLSCHRSWRKLEVDTS